MSGISEQGLARIERIALRAQQFEDRNQMEIGVYLDMVPDDLSEHITTSNPSVVLALVARIRELEHRDAQLSRLVSSSADSYAKWIANAEARIVELEERNLSLEFKFKHLKESGRL